MTPSSQPRTRGVLRAAPGLVLITALATGCGSTDEGSTATTDQVTVTNCQDSAAFPSPAQRMYVAGDGNLLAMVLALGAEKQVAGATLQPDSQRALARVYGKDVVGDIPVASKEQPTMENVLAQRPDVMLAGWNYGYREENKLTPQTLSERDIAPYVLSESCRQKDGARGTMPPWKALDADLENLGAITGKKQEATEVIADIAERRTALEQAPQAERPPTVFLFDSGTKEIFTSGSFGGPQAIIEAAGAKNAMADVDDTWTSVSWERVVAAKPDYFAFVDYPGQSYADKVAVLKSHPATKNLDAVTEERFINLPISAWTSSPLNIDAAEHLRAELEQHELVPASDIEPEHDLQP